MQVIMEIDGKQHQIDCGFIEITEGTGKLKDVNNLSFTSEEVIYCDTSKITLRYLSLNAMVVCYGYIRFNGHGSTIYFTNLDFDGKEAGPVITPLQ